MGAKTFKFIGGPRDGAQDHFDYPDTVDLHAANFEYMTLPDTAVVERRFRGIYKRSGVDGDTITYHWAH